MTTPEIEELKLLVEEKYGRTLNTSTDFDEFSMCLERVTGKHVSASTLKRMWGYVSDRHKPRGMTLDILASFLGYHDFCNFKTWLKTSTRYNSSFFNASQLTSNTLPAGVHVLIGWSPNRLVRLQHTEGSNYEVICSENSKLQVGDKFVTGCFILGQPLYLPYLIRNGKRTPAFVAGRNGGLTMIEVVDNRKLRQS